VTWSIHETRKGDPWGLFSVPWAFRPLLLRRPRGRKGGVRAYLAKHGLSDQTALVIAPGSYPPGHLQTQAHLVEDTIGALGATPAECALITASPAGIDATHAVGAEPIGYARTPADREHLAQAGAACIIPSLADLTLRLRARPLPN
jgi:beta-phosphoglucomutase-like phosphatase (HAD superfamily)